MLIGICSIKQCGNQSNQQQHSIAAKWHSAISEESVAAIYGKEIFILFQEFAP